MCLHVRDGQIVDGSMQTPENLLGMTEPTE